MHAKFALQITFGSCCLEMALPVVLSYLILCAVFLVEVALPLTDLHDGSILRLLKENWENTPKSWNVTVDPCGSWEGISCENSRVTSLGLPGANLSGNLVDEIWQLTELRSLDLSSNPLTGSLSPRLGDSQKLESLILSGCGLSGEIPSELANLVNLTFLALNFNNFSGVIPSTLGNLANLFWLDLTGNQLSGSIPASLSLLKKAKHFHLSRNAFSGPIPVQIFSSDMILVHLLLSENRLTGEIPATLGNVETLEVLRLDGNAFSGVVPNLSKLQNLNLLSLRKNMLTGPIPDLSGMNSLKFVDLSLNAFQPSQAPSWFSTLNSLAFLACENCSIQGEFPHQLFSLPQLQQVNLSNNAFNGTLDIIGNISQTLEEVDLRNNRIFAVALSNAGFNATILLLKGNPICGNSVSNLSFCQDSQKSIKNCSTSLPECGSKTCQSEEKLNPQSCDCSHPFEGTLHFRAPSFRDLSNCTRFRSLQMKLSLEFGLAPGAVSLLNPFFDAQSLLQIEVELFPFSGSFFNRSQVQNMGSAFVHQTFKPPVEFGPYFFIAAPYKFPGSD